MKAMIIICYIVDTSGADSDKKVTGNDGFLSNVLN